MTYAYRSPRRVDAHLKTWVEEDDARRIKDMRADTGWSAARIGIELGVLPSVVNTVIWGRTWRNA
jgi:hypothetical protein